MDSFDLRGEIFPKVHVHRNGGVMAMRHACKRQSRTDAYMFDTEICNTVTVQTDLLYKGPVADSLRLPV